MGRLPSSETQLKTLRRVLNDCKRLLNFRGEELTRTARETSHYVMVLKAIAEGKYPGEQSALAAQHALKAWNK